MSNSTAVKRVKPDIRAITRMVSAAGNLVQGQSDLPINPDLARAAAEIISASQNHYGPSEGDANLRAAVSEKIAELNGIRVDTDARPLELMITNGGTGALVGIAQAFLRGGAVLVFEPFYPYHQKTFEEFGAKVETFELDEKLEFKKDELLACCRLLKSRGEFPLSAIVVCSPANPTGKVMSLAELEAIAEVAKELDLLVISDEVYEHFVTGETPHIPIASLPGMLERTITVNSFSKSWNISGWRLGYVYGPGNLIDQLNKVLNIIYVCPATPLQSALSTVLMANERYYDELRTMFVSKREIFAREIREFGFELYDSGSAFYIWARIPEQFSDAIVFNEMLMKNVGVGMTPGSAFADSSRWDKHVRICIAREDKMLLGALERMSEAFKN